MGNKFKSKDASILVIDSGLGGVSILNALAKAMPKEHFIYFADFAYLPYGIRSEAFIRDRCFKVVDYLSQRYELKAVVLACNSATASAIRDLREHFDIPFFGTEPGVKPAAKNSQSGIAVFATELTLASQQFQRLVKDYAQDALVYSQAAPEWVSLVESGAWDNSEARACVRKVLSKVDSRFDTVLLGCTHFTFLAELIQEELSEKVVVLDTSEAIAKHTHDELERHDLLSTKSDTDDFLFCFSSNSEESVDCGKLELLKEIKDPKLTVAKSQPLNI